MSKTNKSTEELWLFWGNLADDKRTEVYWRKDFGVVIRRGKSWWASNDTRWNLVGVTNNVDLVQPSVGPFIHKMSAIRAYEKAKTPTTPARAG